MQGFLLRTKNRNRDGIHRVDAVTMDAIYLTAAAAGITFEYSAVWNQKRVSQ